MTLTQVWGALLIFIVCPLLGGLPLIAWTTYALTRRSLATLGTGNISVSAAFYHGGNIAGILAVLSEALKGIAAVLLARSFFPADPTWELVALMALVVGRYWFGKGAGTTNVVWGYVVHDPIAACFVFLISGISFTVLRERQQGRLSVLVIFPLMTALRHPSNHDLIGAAVILSILLGWIYTKLPDDLDLPATAAQSEAQSTFKFFRRDRAIRSLNDPLDARKVGQKAATLARLKRSGYPIPMGWVLSPGDDPEPLIELLEPSPKARLIVRSSAVGEDSETASAAGQYESIANIVRREQLLPAISRCFASYNESGAVQYRRDRNLPDTVMSVLIQQQIRGVFSGVAFSRDPIARQGDMVAIEALPGSASQVVSGQVTPESYQVMVPAIDVQPATAQDPSGWVLLDDRTLTVHGSGTIPSRLIQQVAFLARQLEVQQGIPQDIEWSYDGQQLWLLQARPITTLLPIWTRKIAAEVIPGLIHPLTWSINRPLTCGVWGDLFTLVLGDRASGLDFNETATLHYSHAYFNASLLGQLFRRMGLPPESLEFLTRGAKFSKPPLKATLRNVPGLVRLWSRELRLETDFRRDDRHQFAPALAEFAQQPASELDPPAILTRIDRILHLLQTATYYSILAPLSFALRKAIFKVKDDQLDNSDTPEIAALRSLQALARSARQLSVISEQLSVISEQLSVISEQLSVNSDQLSVSSEQSESTLSPHAPRPTLFFLLSQTPDGQAILEQFDALLEQYGYLSEVGTDIAVPTWREDPQPVRSLFAQFCQHPLESAHQLDRQTAKIKRVQRRLTLKGRVTEVYSRLLAELRWSFVTLENRWLESGLLPKAGDIFFLELEEIRQLGEREEPMMEGVERRRSQLEADRALEAVPFLVYGNDPPAPTTSAYHWQSSQQLQGIGASPGQVEGIVKVVRSLTELTAIDRSTILVVPYTDSGWAPLLARAGGLIAEVGGRLSHGAIVAREYRIPAVMDIHNATQLLKDGQRVRINGQTGTVELL